MTTTEEEPKTVDFKTNRNKLFSPVFFKLRDCSTRYIVLYGGTGSGKSYAAHQLELINIMNPGIGDTLIMRKNAADIRESCFKLLKSLIYKYDIQDLFDIVYSNDQRKITYKETGRCIFFKGIDDAEKLKSIVGVKRIIMEEASQFEFDDFLELNRRARGLDGLQTILILNPISENHWIKKQLCDDSGPYRDDTSVLRFIYKDNCNLLGESFLTETDIKEIERLKNVNENQYRIYALAEWGIDNKESKFCWAFDSTQKKKTEREKDMIHWVSFDFNVNPLTCTVAQVFPEITAIRAIESIKLENSDIWKMCERLIASYPDVIWMVTGDATGQNRSAGMADNMNYFMIIQTELGLTDQQLQVPTVNPRIEDNRLLVNAVHKNWTVEIDPEHCSDLIYDLEYVEVNGRGEIIKDRSATNKFADFLDNWRYLINVAVKPHFNWGK